MATQFIYQQPVQAHFQNTSFTTGDQNLASLNGPASYQSFQAGQQHFTCAANFVAHPQQQAFIGQPQPMSHPICQNQHANLPVSYEVITLVPQVHQVMPSSQQPIQIQAYQANPNTKMAYFNQATASTVALNNSAVMSGFVQQPQSCQIKQGYFQAQYSQQQQLMQPYGNQPTFDTNSQNHLVTIMQKQDQFQTQGLKFGTQNQSNPGIKPYKSSPLKFFDYSTGSSSNLQQNSYTSQISDNIRHPEQIVEENSSYKLSNRLMKLTQQLNKKDCQVPDFAPKSYNALNERLFEDSNPRTDLPYCKYQVEKGNKVSSKYRHQPQDPEEDDAQQENALDQTLVEILSSLSEKSSPNTNDLQENQPNVSSKLMKKLTVNDKEKVAMFYDKSQSMNAPKPTTVPKF